MILDHPFPSSEKQLGDVWEGSFEEFRLGNSHMAKASLGRLEMFIRNCHFTSHESNKTRSTYFFLWVETKINRN